MAKRIIMIFPEFENMDIIEGLRKQCDPLSNLVRLHITLVFPFESKLSQSEIDAILKKIQTSFDNWTVRFFSRSPKKYMRKKST